MRLRTLLVTSVVLGLTLGFLLAPDAIRRSQLERAARAWKPGPSDSEHPHEKLISPGVDLNGSWIRTGMDGVSLTFHRREKDGYDVAVHTGGCLWSCSFERTATFADGVVKLNVSVIEYGRNTYDTLYAVQIDDHEYLVPACTVPQLNQSASSSQNFDDVTWNLLARKEIRN